VFVFLRDGKILNLLRGATIIDAAFAIHTEVGLQMKAAEINGLQKPLSYELVNGDVVSILTDAESRPSLDWMRFSRARSTRAKLRSYFRVQQRATDVQKGWLHLKAFVDLCEPLLLEQYGEAPCADSELREFLVDLGHENVDELCTTLARTQVATLQTTLAQLFNLRMDQVDALAQRHHPINRVQKVPLVLPLKQITESANSFALTPILGTPANMCPCCMPVLGDAPVVGIACTSVEGNAPSKDFVVHRSECSEVLKASVEGCEMVPVQWGAPGLEEYASELQVLCDDRKFLLRDVSDVVSLGSEILRTSSQTINDKAALQFKVKVASSQQLCDLVTAILGVSGVTSCDRIEL
jgi:GTP pyrophosphokinase